MNEPNRVFCVGVYLIRIDCGGEEGCIVRWPDGMGDNLVSLTREKEKESI